MNTVFKMTLNEDLEPYPHGDLWHEGGVSATGPSLLCSGEFFDMEGGEDSEGRAKCVSKSVKRGGITCPACLDIIHSIKAIKL